MSRSWMGASESFEDSDWVLVGLPYDGTCSYRPGTRFGPEAIRLASWGLETYSPTHRRDLEEIRFFDAGELELPFGNRDEVLARINRAARETLAAGKRWFGIGGEHLVTFPAIQAYIEHYPDLAILHFDAHADLREEYLGEPLSHAAVMRRNVELIGPDALVQIGIRSGPKAEFDWMARHGSLLQTMDDLPRGLQRLSGRPVFLSLDLDALDPSVLPGTGTPEPGGLGFNELIGWIMAFREMNFVGADVVELSPHYDPSGVSAVVAAKIIREMLFL